ncbi:hypothetical protein QBC40DRAFT_233729 [Triangularia verruculosa]|uniref:Uncharacterized protein n=1 Tax=Triangularia verruculosa TaxID=2587418 RepID=A0AAN6XBZ0_9PEZI|nr:hypothetical protein QBC40DRAFT_233729 [Triangularia verruculosa]
MEGLVSAAGNLSVQPSLRRKPVSAGPANTPPTFYAELEGSAPTTAQPRAADYYEQGLIPVEKTPPPDHEGLIPLHTRDPVQAVAQEFSSSSSPTVTAVPPPPPPQTPGSPAAGYTPAAYPSWPPSHTPHPQPVLVPSTHSFTTPPPVSSSTLPARTAGTHTPGQKLGDFASSVFSRETVKWSKKTASRFGGALKNAATSAHEAATKAQVAAARAAEQRKQRQSSLVVTQQQQWKPHEPQPTNPQSPHPQHWTSSHHQPHNMASPQQSQVSYWPVTQTPAAATVPVSQGQGPYVLSGSQTDTLSSPPPPPPLIGSQYPQASAQPLSPPLLHPHPPSPPPPTPQQPPLPPHAQIQATHLPCAPPTVAATGPPGAAGSFPVPHPPFPPSSTGPSQQHSAAVVPAAPKERLNKPTAAGSSSSALKTVGTGMAALSAVGGLTRLLIAATTGEDVGEMDFGGGGGGEEVTALDSGVDCEAGGGVEDGGGPTGYSDTYADPYSSTMASMYHEQQAAMEANHLANISAQANANALSYVSTTYEVMSNPYGYGSYGYTPDPASYI